MRSKTLELLIDTLRCEVKSCKLNKRQKQSLLEDLSNAINSLEYDSHTDEDIEVSITRFLEKNGPSSGKEISKGISIDIQTLGPYLKGLVDNRTIFHNKKGAIGSKYFLDENPVLNLMQNRIEMLKESVGLTIRETNVLFLLTIGLTRKEIANKMSMSNKTVSGIIKEMKNKLSAETDRDLVWKVIVDLA